MISKPITYQPTETFPTPSGDECVKSGLNEEDNAVDKDGTAGHLENKPQTQNTLRPEYLPAYMAEDVLLNSLQNLMVEAVSGELDLTAHPRTVILPPVSSR